MGLAEIGALPASHERFDAKVHVLIEDVRQHVSEEERELFPLLRRLLSREELEKLGRCSCAPDGLRRRARTPPRPTSRRGSSSWGSPRARTTGAATPSSGRPASRSSAGGCSSRARSAPARTPFAVRGGGSAARSPPAAVERRVARGRNAARRAQRRLGEGIEQAGRDLQPATVH